MSWVKTDEQRPPINGEYIGCCYDEVFITYYDGCGFTEPYGGFTIDVDYWQPLPTPPQREV